MISIHALRVEGDELSEAEAAAPTNFYPRPPGGGRPGSLGVHGDLSVNFYPRPPGGGRLDEQEKNVAGRAFLSTPSGWRATAVGVRRGRLWQISIHALRVEGDQGRRLA